MHERRHESSVEQLYITGVQNCCLLCETHAVQRVTMQITVLQIQQSAWEANERGVARSILHAHDKANLNTGAGILD